MEVAVAAEEEAVETGLAAVGVASVGGSARWDAEVAVGGGATAAAAMVVAAPGTVAAPAAGEAHS